MGNDTFDLLVVGAGTHGTGVAADGAGRGLATCVIDPADVGESTAKVSSRLLVGGLRYLERWHLGLVRQSLRERQVLMQRAPFLVQVRPFVQVFHPERMKFWRSRLLLRAYDWLGGSRLGPHQVIDLRGHAYGQPLRREFERAFVYPDCTGNDARISVLNARLAAASRAEFRLHTRILRVRRADRRWELDTENAVTGERRQIHAAALVNTAGPWMEQLLREAAIPSRCRARQVKISHLVVPALYEGDQVYVLTGASGHRICVNPIGDGLHLVGAAESDFGGQSDPDAPSPTEVSWLCDLVSEHFAQPLHERDVVHAYSGLRTVYDDPTRTGTQVARHFLLDLDCPDCHSPLLRVYGGRVTNYRCMSESALEVLKPWLPRNPGRWTRHTPLPGGILPAGGFDSLLRDLRQRFPALAEPDLRRLARCYGSDTPEVLATATPGGDPHRRLGGGLFAAELQYLREHEWVNSPVEALRRVGLEHLKNDGAVTGELAACFAANNAD